jgi:hypothetical protein
MPQFRMSTLYWALASIWRSRFTASCSRVWLVMLV